MSEWRDIATVPKDGTVIDLWCPAVTLPNGYVLEARRKANCRWNVEHEKGGYWEGEFIECEDSFTELGAWCQAPTHWMPLPEPPTEEAAKG
jgi:hypothetical protein